MPSQTTIQFPRKRPSRWNFHQFPLSRIYTLPLLLLRSLISSNHGYRKQFFSILTHRFGSLSWSKHLFHKVLASLMVVETRAQRARQSLKHMTPSKVRRRWTSRILEINLHSGFTKVCANNQADPFITNDEILPILQDLQECFPDQKFDASVLPFQPFRLDFALLLKEGIPSGALTPLHLLGLWDRNTKPKPEEPDLQVCRDNWSSANSDPNLTRSFIQQEVPNDLVEEIPDITTAESRWLKGIGFGKLELVCGQTTGTHNLWNEW